MAVLAMKRINIYALKSSRKKILEYLQIKGAVEVDYTSPVEDQELFEKMDTSSARSTFEKNAQNAQAAVEILDKRVPAGGGMLSMFAGREPLSSSQYGNIVSESVEMSSVASKIILLDKEITENKSDILRYEAQIDALVPWEKLDISMRIRKTKSTSVFIGSFSREVSELSFKEELAENAPDIDKVYVEIISADPQQTCFMAVTNRENGTRLESALKSMGMIYPASPSKQPPKERMEILQERVKNKQTEIERLEQEILSYKDKRQQLVYTADFFTARAEKYRVLGDLWQSKSVFIMSGYIPELVSGSIKSELEEKYSAYVELEDTTEDEDVPVVLKNNGYAAPVEGVVENYSMPGRGEVDPCSVMAIFYYVLFGLMLSDAAYGAIMTIGCAVLLAKFKNMESGMKKTLKMFMYSGISTVFWGIMFGSFFGDLIGVVSSTFFGSDFAFNPVWFAPLDDPIKMLLFSFTLGVIHLFTGLAMNLYQLLRAKKYKDALYDVIFWYMLVGGLIVVLVASEMFQEMFSISLAIPSVVSTICMVLAAVGAVGIIATAGRESKSPVKRLLKGIYGLYDISGYLSDILSYSRLLALGLATGVIASVFNQIGSMFGGGVGGAIAFVIVFLIGHTLNIGINALGAYVHTNRLQYVEFFGKFYSGGGRKFRPFTTNTKYIKIKEEN